jgi:GrpB-like predicted nucleotidyltransferase (UPF0157 family)
VSRSWDCRALPPLDDAIEIVQYDPAWRLLFARERQRLFAVLVRRTLGIERIGSTAVPGLAAKPVIDILVRVVDYPLRDEALAALGRLGYQYRGEDTESGGQFFRTQPRTRHLRVLPIEDGGWNSRLIFRDHLGLTPRPETSTLA